MARTKVQSELIATNAISGTIIADNAITATHIATNAISGTLVQDSGITTTMIAANNVTGAKIVSDGIEHRHMHSNVISGLSTVTAASGDFLLIGDTSDSNNLKKALVSDIGADGITASGSNTIIQSPDNTNVMFVNNSAEVGIGTNDPDGLLHISSGNSGDAIVIIQADEDNNDEGDNPQLWFKQDGDYTEGAVRLSDNKLQIISNVNSAGGISFLTGSNLVTGTTDPATGATEKMFISTDGDLFLNSTSAMDNCFVTLRDHSNGEAFLGIEAKDDSNVGIRLGHGGTRKWVMYSDPSDNLIWYSNANSAERFNVVAAGNFHIGHTTRTAYNSLGTLTVKQLASDRGIGIIDTGENNTFKLTNENTVSKIYHNLAANVIEIGSGNKAVTMPSQPCFHAYGATSGTSNADVIFGNTYVNVGSHYSTSNGRFTAPVAGVYLFFWGAIGNNNNDVYRYWIMKNGSKNIANSNNDIHLRLDTTGTGSEYEFGTRVQMLSLAANDYVQINFKADSSNSTYIGSNDDYMNFGGYLIG